MLKPLGTYETRGSASLQLQGGAGGGNSWRSPAGAPAAVEPGEGGGGTGGGKADSRWGKKGGAVAGGGGEGGAGGVHGRQMGEKADSAYLVPVVAVHLPQLPARCIRVWTLTWMHRQRGIGVVDLRTLGA